MQPISAFNSNLGTAILLTGGAGAGKTALGLRLFPKTYAFVADLNFQSGIDYLNSIGAVSNVVGFDLASPDSTGKKVPVNQRFDRMFKCMSEAFASPDVDAVFLDSATFIEDIIKAKICGAPTEAAIKLEGFSHWGMLVMIWKSLIMQSRESGKKLILSTHETKEQDESDKIFKYQIAVDGSIRGKFPAYFSDVWRCECVESANKHVWQVRTLSNLRQEYLKNTFGLDAVMLPDSVIKRVREFRGIPLTPPTPVNVR